MAFCADHARELIQQGIVLKTLSEVHADKKEMIEGPKRRQQEYKIRVAQEQFVEGLKRSNR